MGQKWMQNGKTEIVFTCKDIKNWDFFNHVTQYENSLWVYPEIKFLG